MKISARLFKAFSDENRLRILHLLQERQMCVCELAFVLGISQPSVSKHIKKLFEADIIRSRQDGFWTMYYFNVNNIYSRKLLKVLSERLNNDAVAKEDRKRARKADRTKLCCKA